MDFQDQFILRQIIMSHYQKPTHKGFLSEDLKLRFRINSPECIDDITLEIVQKSGIIQSARFEGVACTVSTASTDILCSLIESLEINKAKKIIQEFENMIFEKEYDADALGEAVAFKNTYKQSNRVRCAIIGSNAIKELIEGQNE